MAKLRLQSQALVVALAVLVMALASGCVWIPSPGAPQTPSDGGEVPIGENPAPGVYKGNDGAATVVGVLVYRDLEGGFWAIADTADPSEAETAPSLAVVLPDDTSQVAGEYLANLSGKYVSARGLLDDGPNIYMAGPMLLIEFIEQVDADE